jgi:hypothetical protein
MESVETAASVEMEVVEAMMVTTENLVVPMMLKAVLVVLVVLEETVQVESER